MSSVPFGACTGFYTGGGVKIELEISGTSVFFGKGSKAWKSNKMGHNIFGKIQPVAVLSPPWDSQEECETPKRGGWHPLRPGCSVPFTSLVHATIVSIMLNIHYLAQSGGEYITSCELSWKLKVTYFTSLFSNHPVTYNLYLEGREPIFPHPIPRTHFPGLLNLISSISPLSIVAQKWFTSH